jgi:hypothetical protein
MIGNIQFLPDVDADQHSEEECERLITINNFAGRASAVRNLSVQPLGHPGSAVTSLRGRWLDFGLPSRPSSMAVTVHG